MNVIKTKYKKEVEGVTYTADVYAKKNTETGEVSFDDTNIQRFNNRLATSVCFGPIGPEAFVFLRQWLELSTKDLAEILGLNQRTIQRWESDKNSTIQKQSFILLSMITLKKRGIDFNLDKLLTGERREPGDKVFLGPC